MFNSIIYVGFNTSIKKLIHVQESNHPACISGVRKMFISKEGNHDCFYTPLWTGKPCVSYGPFKMVTFSAKCLIKDCHCSTDCTQSACLLKTGQCTSHTHRSNGIHHGSHLWSFRPTLFFDQWKWVLYQIKDDEKGFKMRSELAFYTQFI